MGNLISHPIVEEDPVIKGIYERLAENTTEPDVNTFIQFGPLTLLVRQEWIKLKNTLLTERADKLHKTVFLRGTSGRGKSSFVYYLIYCILITANVARKRKADHANEPVVGYVRNEGSAEVKYLLTPSKIRRVASIPISAYYYIADIKGDVNRTNLANCFTMVVASDDAGKDEFRKRVDEARNSGYTFAITSPTREEMHLIFEQNDQMSPEEIDFRLDVVGCNPRAFAITSGVYKCYPEFDTLIEESFSEVLNRGQTDADVEHLKWVKFVVMNAIGKAMASDQAKINMNSLFREDVLNGDVLLSVFTSTFMCFLAGRIRDKFTNDTLGCLTMLFGRGGVGNCHEYDAHNFFCGLTSETHPCWKLADRKWEELPLGGGCRQKVIFRNINSISNALLQSVTINLRYLLPSITNLALIDSIIPDRIPYVLQMTVSSKHRGATNRMSDIYTELGNPETVRMIFVVPENVVAKFTFPTDMPEYVQMYLTVAKTMTLVDAKKLRN